MPEISNRAKKMPASAIRKFIPLALEIKKKNVYVYHLNIGQPDIKTPKPFMDAIKKFKNPVIEYEHSAGLIDLRETLTSYYKEHNINLTADEIIITSGGSEAIIMAIGITTNPGEEIIVPEPYYTNYNTFAAQNDVALVPFPTRLEENFAIKNIEKLESLITKKTKAILFSSPCNPTGTVFTRKETEEIARIAKKHDLFVISDEVYREFAYDGKSSTSIMHIDGMENNAVIIDSSSKRYSLCGARIGWIASKNKDVMDAALKYGQARLSVATLEQFGVNEIIKNGQKYIEEAKHEYDERRRYTYDELTKAGIKCGYPSGALYMIADIGVNAEEFVVFMMTKYSGIEKYKETTLVTPAENFYKTPCMGRTQIRFAFVLEKKKLERAIFHLLKGLEEFKSSKK